MRWLVRAAARTVPAEWREPVTTDLEEEAQAQQRSSLWLAYQTCLVALRYRWTFRGDAMLSDVRYAIRSLRSAKWFTTGAVATFAVGIGINVAVFCAVDRLLFRPLPYAHPESIVLLRSCALDGPDCAGSFPAAVAFQLSQHSETMTDVSVAGFPLAYRLTNGPSDDKPLSLVAISPGGLRALGVKPILGRETTDLEITSKSPVAWISEEAWRGRFGADAGILQRVVWSWDDARPVAVIGVLPRGFVPPSSSGQDPAWTGLVVDYGGNGWAALRPKGRLAVPFARLKPGVSVAQAQSEVDAIVNSLPLEPRQQTRERLRVDRIDASLFAYYRNYLWLVVTAAALVLVMACANLASLFLARGRSRQQLAAVCTALGATSGRLIGSAVIEALLVCLAGAAGALLVLVAAQKAMLLFLPPIFSRYAAGLSDLRVIGFSLAITIVSAIVAGTLPGWRATRLDVLPLLQRGTRSGRRVRVHGGRGLLVFEAALGAMLVLGAVLAGRTLLALTNENLGFQPEGLYLVSATGGVTPQDPKDPAQRMAAQRQGLQQLVDALRGLPGAVAVGAGDYNPASNAAPMRGFAKGVRGPRVQVTPGYVEAVGLHLMAGRAFTDDDVSAQLPVAMMNRSGARLVWPDAEPAQIVGRVWTPADETPRRVIGIVDDMKFQYGAEAFQPISYLPVGAEVTAWGTISVRMHPGQTLPLTALRTFIAERLPNARVNGVAHAADAMSPVLRDPRFRATLLGGFALTALLLAGVGLYAVASYDAAQRRYEMGVRLTLGATPRGLRKLILRDAAAPVFIGGLIGLVGAWLLAKVGQSFLYQTDARDLTFYVPVLVLLVGTAAIAAWMPARRASRTDPAIVLRAQ